VGWDLPDAVPPCWLPAQTACRALSDEQLSLCSLLGRKGGASVGTGPLCICWRPMACGASRCPTPLSDIDLARQTIDFAAHRGRQGDPPHPDSSRGAILADYLRNERRSATAATSYCAKCGLTLSSADGDLCHGGNTDGALRIAAKGPHALRTRSPPDCFGRVRPLSRSQTYSATDRSPPSPSMAKVDYARPDRMCSRLARG